MIFAPPPDPGPFVGSSFALTNHWNPTGCASAGLAPLMRMRSACLMSRQWLVIAPRPNVAAKLTTVGPCQTRACCSRCTTPKARMSFVAKYPSSDENAAPPAKAMPSVRFTVFPLASLATKVLSREDLMFCAILSRTKSQLFSSHFALPAAQRRGAEIAPPGLDPAIAQELLELARVVAHSKERSFAPLASFTAGLATERLRIAQPDADLTSFIREVRQ